MGSRLNHSAGEFNDNSNWFIISWSKAICYLRVSHLIGMHTLQIRPPLSFYVVKQTKLTLSLAFICALLALLTLTRLLKSKFLGPDAKKEVPHKT
ncbi:hypothetical protein [Flavobacterium tiangeerense]|uniref:hypothetical protein n=1 Tax=Flavobacterium tiangeerense TaxID=459471 RepID=UPI0011A59490|nr:hypothetical protein [Flavobacterium tiangeerense]